MHTHNESVVITYGQAGRYAEPTVTKHSCWPAGRRFKLDILHKHGE